MASENKRYAVKISPKALQQLSEHSRFIAEVSEEATLRLIDSFYEAAVDLAVMPERCHALRDSIFPLHRYRKLLFSEHYLAIYLIETDIVHIEYVVDCKQDYDWLIK